MNVSSQSQLETLLKKAQVFSIVILAHVRKEQHCLKIKRICSHIDRVPCLLYGAVPPHFHFKLGKMGIEELFDIGETERVLEKLRNLKARATFQIDLQDFRIDITHHPDYWVHQFLKFVTTIRMRRSKIPVPLIKGLSFIDHFFSGQMDFSSQSSTVIIDSREEAFRRGSDSIRLEHIVISLLKSQKGRVVEILQNLNCSVKNLQREIEKEANKLSRKSTKKLNIPFSIHAEHAMKESSSIANEFKSKAIEPEHIFLAILKTESDVLGPVFQAFHITCDNCYHHLRKISLA